MYVCMCMYVGRYVRTNVHVYVYVNVDVDVYAWMHGCMDVCVHLPICVCVYV